MNYHKIRNQNTYDEPLSEQISYRVTLQEKEQYEVIARENEISVPELMRNLARENIHQYAISEDLKKNLQISGKIDQIILKNRVISSRKASNLSKINEFLSDFEDFLEAQSKNILDSDLRSKRKDLLDLINIISQVDVVLFNKIKVRASKILKNKHLKALDC